MAEKKACKTCKYRNPMQKDITRYYEVYNLECRRSPPQLDSNNYSKLTKFPAVLDDDWCYEWKGGEGGET
jgi:uncharacterized metal-binding protein